MDEATRARSICPVVMLWIGIAGLLAPGMSVALVININPLSAGLSGDALLAFQRAAHQWESVLFDPVAVNIDADLISLGSPTILGQASSVELHGSYSLIEGRMVADARDEADDAIVNALPSQLSSSPDCSSRQACLNLPAGIQWTGAISATKANLKAMGFAGLDALEFGGRTDARIEFNSQFSFDFDNSDGIAAGQWDFETVAAHEIGHVLGFVSAVDAVDVALANGQTGVIDLNPLDLFRFQGEMPRSAASFTQATRDLTVGGGSFFSDAELQVLFSTGAALGDGRQASHWKDDRGLGLMDPTLAPGEASRISGNDIRALDVIGWDFVTVPLPGSLPFFTAALTGFAALFAWRRRAETA